jgi:hypothetical protein
MHARHSVGSAGMLPAVSGILPDNSAGLRVALPTGVAAVLRFAQEPPGNMPAAASRMLALPCLTASEVSAETLCVTSVRSS